MGFYDSFHKNAIIQTKVISKRYFTYRKSISFVEKILKYYVIKKDVGILDYGCGVGTLSLYFARQGYKLTGLDISARAIKVAEESSKKMNLGSNVRFYTLKHGNNIVKDKKYDLILCFEVIEHFRKDMGLIKHLINKLNKNGYLLISTPTRNAPLYRLSLAHKFDQSVGHLRRYDPDKLRNNISKYNNVKLVQIVKTEDVLRNLFFVLWPFTYFGKFIKGYLSDIVTIIDNMLIPIFGESNIYLVIKKI